MTMAMRLSKEPNCEEGSCRGRGNELSETEATVYSAFEAVLFIEVNHVPEQSEAAALIELSRAYELADQAVGFLHDGQDLAALRLAGQVTELVKGFSERIELVPFPSRVTPPDWEI